MKIKRHINENEVDLLFDVSDIEDAISDIRSLTNSFEDVHVALRRELKDQYKEKYPDYDKQIEDIAKWVKEAKKAIKEKKQASFVSHRDPVAQAKTRLKTEEKHLRAKIECEITTFNEENSFFISDIERNLLSIDELSKDYTNLFIQIEEMGEDFLKEFGTPEKSLFNTYLENPFLKMELDKDS